MPPETESPDTVFSRICEASARLMSGSVNRRTMAELKKQAQGTPDSYPWREVVDRVLLEPVDQESLVEKTLRAQRDWIVRGGRETPGKGLKYKTKSLVATLVARLIFMVVFIPVVVLVLVLIKHKWTDFDIYSILEWLGQVWPSVFGPR